MPVSAVTIDKESLRELNDSIKRGLNLKYSESVNSQMDRLVQLIEKRNAAKKFDSGISPDVVNMYNNEIEKIFKELSSLTDIVSDSKEKIKELTKVTSDEEIDKELLEKFIEFQLTHQRLENEKKELEERKLIEEKKGDEANKVEIERLGNRLDEIKKQQEDTEKTFKDAFGGEGGFSSILANNFKGDRASQEKVSGTIRNVQEANIRNDRQIADEERRQKELIEKGKEAFNIIKQVGNVIWKTVRDGVQMWMKFDDQAISTAKRLGMTTRSEAIGYTKNLIESSKDLARNFGLSAEQASKMRDAYIESTGRATLLSRSQMEDVAAASKLMSQETVQGAIKVMDSMGASSQEAVEVLDRTYARAKNTGLDTEKASKALVENLSLANKLNFRNGVDGISKMTVYSQRIKMNLQEVANVADKFSTIEGAIEGAARLQMLGGTGAMLGSNPMAMMYEALADPEALFKRMGDMFSQQAYFDRAKGESVIDPVQMQIIREQAKAMGMNPDEAIQSAKQQGKLRAIENDLRRARPGLYRTLTEDQKAAIGNKAEYSKESGFTITYFDEEKGEDVTAKVNELTADQLEKITKDNIEPVTDIRDNVRRIAHELVSFRERKDSMVDVWKMAQARVLHKPMSAADSALNGVNDSSAWGGLTDGGGWTGVGMGLNLVKGMGELLLMGKMYKMMGRVLTGGSSKPSTASGSGRLSRMFRRKPGARFAAIREKYGIERNTAHNQYEGRIKRSSVKNARRGGNLPKARNIVSEAKPIKPTSATKTFVKSGSKLMKGGGRLLKGGGKLLKGGAALAVVAGTYEGYTDWTAANRKYNAEKDKLSDAAKNNYYMNGRYYGKEEIEAKGRIAKTKRKVERAEAVGGGVGTAGGGLAGGVAGAKIGAAIGSVIAPGVGTIIGGAIGGLAGGIAGAYLGKKAGKYGANKLTPEQEADMIDKHMRDIKGDGVKDNLRRIVLPVESIDYNVSLIANQLGIIAATPARGNVYLESEEAGERINPIIASNVETTNIESSRVNEVDSQIINASQTYQPRGPITLNVSGSIDLKCNGSNVGSITPEVLRDMIKNNPSLQKEIVNVAFHGIQVQSNGLRTNKNPDYTRGVVFGADTN